MSEKSEREQGASREQVEVLEIVENGKNCRVIVETQGGEQSLLLAEKRG